MVLDRFKDEPQPPSNVELIPCYDLMLTLPKDAMFAGELVRKSYTLKSDTEDEDATIAVILNKNVFYVCPVHSLPEALVDDYKINKQHGVNIPISADPLAAWAVAKQIAGWSS